MSISSYTEGNIVDFFLTFTDENDARIDPTTVWFVYKWFDKMAAPVGAYQIVTLTYVGDSVPAVGIVWRGGSRFTGDDPNPIGAYTARVDTTGMLGTLYGSGESSGIGQAAGVLVVKIVANPTD